MANRLTKGNGLFGSLRTNGPVRAKTLSVSRAANTIADGGSMAITASQAVTDGIVSATPTQARNLAIPSASTTIAAVGDYAVGDSFEVTIINLAAATHALTLTGSTIVGSATISAASSATYLVRIASASTVVWYRK